MHRVRMALPFLEELHWHAEVVSVHPSFSDMPTDPLLGESIPAGLSLHYVKAWNKRYTSRIGMGSIALRSLWFYLKKVNELLRENRFDLIYFSTTQFPICILGAYWKKRFGVPYVIDMQDPWHSDYYQNKPKEERPKKHWFSYRLNKFLEPIAMRAVAGLISVSPNYICMLENRYPRIAGIPTEVIPFGAFTGDLEIARKYKNRFPDLLSHDKVNIVYVGRGGADMSAAACALFQALQSGIKTYPDLYKRLHLYFIGTSYAPEGEGKKSFMNCAENYGLAELVSECTDRISFYHALVTLHDADGLFIPGSDDPAYSASKLYPYLLTGKPLLTLFNSASPANAILREYEVRYALNYDLDEETLQLNIQDFLRNVLSGTFKEQAYPEAAVQKYGSKNLTRLQCLLFDKVCCPITN